MEQKTTVNWPIRNNSFPPPNPIPLKECACGCGYTFQPRRRDHIYLNNTHANFGYNHGERKEKNKKAKELNIKLARNERILKKYHDAYHGNPVVAPLLNLKVDGFLNHLFLSISSDNNETYYYLYNYAFTVYVKDNQTLLKIFKIKKNESN